MLAKLLGNGDQMKNETPTVTALPARRPNSEKVLAAAQYVEELEMENAELKKQLETERAQNRVLGERNVYLQKDNNTLLHQRDELMLRNHEIMTGWNNAMGILRTVMEKPEPQPQQDDDPRIQQAIQGIEREIVGTPPDSARSLSP